MEAPNLFLDIFDALSHFRSLQLAFCMSRVFLVALIRVGAVSLVEVVGYFLG